MAYNMELAERIRARLAGTAGLEEKRLFGGVGFLIHGNLACGVHKDELMVRIAPEKNAELLRRPHTRPFDLSGKPMAGWVLVASGGWKREADLGGWIKLGVEFAGSLPPKR